MTRASRRLQKAATIARDVEAVQHGRVVERVANRAIGRILGRLTRRLWR